MALPLRAFPVLLLLTFLLSAPQARAELQPSDVPFEGRLFGVGLLRFSPTKKVSLLEQYFRKNVVKHREQVGASLLTVEHFRTKAMGGFKDEAKRSRILEWIDALEKDHPDLTLGLEAARLYTRWTFLASNDMTRTPEEFEAARKAIQATLDAKEKSPWSLLAAGLLRDLLEEDPQASTLPSAVEFFESASRLAGQTDGHLHYTLGGLLALLGDREQVPRFCKSVATEFEKSLLIHPGDKQLYAAVASQYHQIYEDFEEQEIPLPFWFEELVLKRLIAVEPTDPRSHNNLAFLYLQYGVNLKEALKEAQIANQLQPETPALQDTLGWAYYKAGNTEKAIEILEKALELDPELSDAHFHLATVYYDSHKYEQAIRHFRATIRLDPENAFALNNLAYLYSERGIHLQEGLELVSRALELQPDNSAFLDTKGWIFYRLGRLEEADEFVKKAVELQPDVSELHLHKGQISLERKHHEEARNHFEKALAYDPKNRDLARQLARIYALDSLRQGMDRFLKIPSARRDKTNVEVFYRAMAEAYELDGLYEDSLATTRAFLELPATLEAPEAEASPTELSLGAPDRDGSEAPDSSSFRAMVTSFPSQTHFVFALEHLGVIGLFDAVAAKVRLPFPLQAFRGQILPKLPKRIGIGVQVSKQNPEEMDHLVLVQMAEELIEGLFSRIPEGGPHPVPVPGTQFQAEIHSAPYKEVPMATVSLRGVELHLAPAQGMLALTRSKPSLLRWIDQMLEGETGPGFSRTRGFMDFEDRLNAEAQARLFGSPEGILENPKFPLSKEEQALFESVELLTSQYTYTPSKDELAETSVLYPKEGAQHSVEDADLARRFAIKSLNRAPASEALDLNSVFGVVEGRIEGSMSIRQVKTWIETLVQRLARTSIDAPALEAPDSLPSDQEEEDPDGGIDPLAPLEDEELELDPEQEMPPPPGSPAPIPLPASP